MEAFQETVRKSGPAATGSYTLIGAIILLGGIGYAVDRWRGTAGTNTGEVLQVHRGPDGAVTALDIATFILTRTP